jgi:hypothetical protein
MNTILLNTLTLVALVMAVRLLCWGAAKRSYKACVWGLIFGALFLGCNLLAMLTSGGEANGHFWSVGMPLILRYLVEVVGAIVLVCFGLETLLIDSASTPALKHDPPQAKNA